MISKYTEDLGETTPNIGALIKHYRLQRGWSRRQLADKIRCSETTIQNYEGKPSVGVGLDRQMLIADALRVPLKVLRGGVMSEVKNTEDCCGPGLYRIEDFSEEELNPYRVQQVEKETQWPHVPISTPTGATM
jgi:transcriptional regulator with XRE-family HTH domain